jgi:serine/threonine protein kinase
VPEESGQSESANPIILAGCQLIEKLGSGAMGSVFKALQLSMDRMVAIKILTPELAENRGFLKRFRREAHAAGRLSHPNIVTGIDVGEAEGVHYFVMEYVEGESLMDLIRREGTVDEKKAAHIGAQIARALDHAHEHGILHRDVKPQNVLLSVDGPAKLCDLGLVRSVLHSADGTITEEGADLLPASSDDLSLTREGAAVGTPYYLSPEQAAGEKDIDGRADIYSLGATLFHAVTGQIPFKGDTASAIMEKHIKEPPPPVRELAPEVSHRMAAVIEKCLEKDPDDRYLHAEELADDLERIAAGKPPAIARPSMVLHPRTSGRRADRHRDYESDSSQVLRAVAAAEKSRQATIVVIVSTVAAASVIIGILSLAGRRREERAPTPVPKESAESRRKREDEHRNAELEKMYEQAVKWVEDHPDDYKEAVTRFERLRNRGPGTKWERKASTAIRDIRSKRDKAAEAAFAPLTSQAESLVAAGNYDKALEVLGNTPARFREVLEPLAEAKCSSIRRAAQRRVNQAVSAAERLSEAGEPAKGLEMLDTLAPVKYSALDGRVALLRDKLRREMKDAATLAEKKRVAASRDRLAAMMAEFDAAVEDPDRARSVTSKALRNRDMAPVYDQVRAAAAVAKALQKIRAAEERIMQDLVGKEVELHTRSGTHKGKILKITLSEIDLSVRKLFDTGSVWAKQTIAMSDLTKECMESLLPTYDPKTPDEAVAAAMIALAKHDLRTAGKALDLAGAHSLAERYRKKLDAAERTRAEDDARSMWTRRISPLFGKDKFWRAGALRAKKLLEEFDKKYGETEFAKDKGEAVARLRIRIAPLTGEQPSQISAALASKAFKGRVESFDRTARRIRVVWDLSDEKQLEDFECELDRHGSRYHEGRLSVGRSTKCHRAGHWRQFSSDDVTIALSYSLEGDLGKDGHISIGFGTPSEGNTGARSLGQFVFFADKEGFALANIGKLGYEKEFKRVPGTLPQRGVLEVSHKDGNVTASIDGKNVFEGTTPETEDPLGPGVSFGGGQPRYEVTRIEISGLLDKAWMEKAGLEATPAATVEADEDKPAAGYSAVWTKLTPKFVTREGRTADKILPRSGRPGAAYDAKRKLCIFCGGGRSDLWTLDLAGNRWTCLQKDERGDGTATPIMDLRTPLAYDPDKDCYWLYAGTGNEIWAYDPESGKWRKRFATEKNVIAMGYSPELKKLVAFHGASSSIHGLCLIDPVSAEVRSRPKCPITFRFRGTWQSPGGFSSPDRSGRFLVFSGLRRWEVQEGAWLYDPSADAWTEVKSEESPTPRQHGNLTYHSRLGLWVLFGGRGGEAGSKAADFERLGGIWAFDPSSKKWTTVRANTPPDTGESCMFLYDDKGDSCVLLRYDESPVETWTLKLTAR